MQRIGSRGRAQPHSRLLLSCVLLVACCVLPALLVSGKESSDATAASAEHPSGAAERPYHIHDSHGGVPPAHVVFRGSKYTRDDIAEDAALAPTFSQSWYLYLAGTICCICLAALAAGLTVGLVSIDPFDLAVIQTTEEADCSTEEEIAELRREKEYAARLMPLVTKHHLLLVTLLVMNSFANELLPLLLDNLVPSWVAVIMSVSAVLLFGEILPSSIFTGRNQLRYAAALTPLVTFFMFALFLIAWPIAYVLDATLGVEDESRLRRSELKSLIRLQANRPTSLGHTTEGGSGTSLLAADSPTNSEWTEEEAHERGLLSLDEMTILHGVLEMKDRTVGDATVPLAAVNMLDLNTVLDLNEMAHILHQGHSRIPIFEGDRQNIRGVLLVKRLIVVNPEDHRPLRTIATRWPLICSPEMPLLSLLSLFQTGRSHMAIVADDPEKMMAALKAEEPIPPEVHVLGICTLEDVIESLIKTDIADETDVIGVRSHLEHSAAVRKRIQRLKSLAAREAAPQKLTSRLHTHTRGQSIFARMASGSIGARTDTRTFTAAATPTAAATTTTTGAIMSPGQTIKRQLSGGGGVGVVTMSNTSPPLLPQPQPSNGVATESSSLVHSLSRAPTLTYQSTEETKIDFLSSTLAVDTQTPAATPRPVLPRDASFSRLPKTPSSVVWTPAAPHALPPHVEHSLAALSPQPLRSTGSVLRPRANFSSDAMHRRDLDAATILALRTASQAAVGGNHPQGAQFPHPPLHPAAHGGGGGTGGAATVSAGAIPPTDQEEQPTEAEEDPERQKLLEMETSNDL